LVGKQINDKNALAAVIESLRNGKIAAIKGLGGFHLVCDATNNSAVSELRRRKRRDEKPFAVMVQNLADAEVFCEISPLEKGILESPQRPIILLKKRNNRIAESVAPKSPSIGVMLAYTPLHYLLLEQMNGTPLVMTSGNISDEPISYENEPAVERLKRIADVFLLHDRPIEIACDDSVLRTTGNEIIFMRRSRGYAPEPMTLPFELTRPALACGGHLKNTFALGADRHAFLSQHLGDLEEFKNYQTYIKSIGHFEKLFDIRPEVLAYDIHPDYASTQYAAERIRHFGLEGIPVQHHHAHMASCMAENGLMERVIGVTFDGSGLGTDGTIWGGEFLIGDYAGFERAAHLRCVKLPGGERAIWEPWRMALSYLHDAGEDLEGFTDLISRSELSVMKTLIEKELTTPQTSSSGRLFDAAASLLGVRHRVSFEGQAAMELEWLASESNDEKFYPYEISSSDPLVIDCRPLVSAIQREIRKKTELSVIARRFHVTLAEIISRVCVLVRQKSSVEKVVLSGGVFMNAILLSEARKRLEENAFHVFTHRLVPANDGGLSLGQMAIAAYRSRV
jgi:hydrogenase maturation protein HypF